MVATPESEVAVHVIRLACNRIRCASGIGSLISHA
jgi:hypothetical protein